MPQKKLVHLSVKIDHPRLEYLKYLDLSIEANRTSYRESDRFEQTFRLKCNCNKPNFRHLIHSETNQQLNTIVDLQINLARNIIEYNKQQNIKIEQLIEDNKNIKKIVQTLHSNIDYINSQIDSFVTHSSELLNKNSIEKFPSKEEIRNLVQLLINKPKNIEVIVLEFIEKINTKTEIFKEEIEKIQLEIKELKRLTLI